MRLSTHNLFKQLQAHSDIITLNDEQKHMLQECIKEISKDIFCICEENGIHAMLYAGSVLGAIRHRGFIPWDDDIDICVYRKDYDRFVNALENAFPEKYWIHTPKGTKNYGSIVTKVILRGTKVRLLEDFENKEYGAFVDVFVIENVFDNVVLRRIQCFITYLLKGIISCKRIERDEKYLLSYFSEGDSAKKTIKTKAIIGRLFCFFKLDTWVHMTDKCAQMCKNDESQKIYIPGSFVSPKGLLMERSMLGKGKIAEFEGEKWPIPEESDQYLRMWYGDYMKIPKEEDREQHGYVEFSL